MKNFEFRLKSIFAVSLLLAAMLVGAATLADKASSNQEAFGEALSFTNVLYGASVAVHVEEMREDAVSDILDYAETYAVGDYKEAIRDAVAEMEWTQEGVNLVIKLLLGSSGEYLYSLDDDQLWYSAFGLELTALLWSTALGETDYADEAADHLVDLFDDAPDKFDPFFGPVLSAMLKVTSADHLDTEQIQDILAEIELAARSDI